jgi:DNA-damage-inducible protein J
LPHAERKQIGDSFAALNRNEAIMGATASINIKVDPELKRSVEEIFNSMGLNLTTGLTLYLKQVQSKRSIPFEVVAPSPWEETIASMKEAERILSGEIKAKSYDSPEEMHRAIFGGEYL